MWHLTVKIKGKKYTAATWNGTQASNDVFWHHGLKGEVEGSYVTAQKIYAGRLPGCVDLTDTDAQAELYRIQRHIRTKRNMGQTDADILYLYPEWKPYL